MYRYGARTPEPLGRLRLADGWTQALDQPGDPAGDVYLTVALAVRKAWREGEGGCPDCVHVEDLRRRVEPLPPPKPRPEVVRSGRLRRPDTKPMTLRELAEREAPGWKPPKD